MAVRRRVRATHHPLLYGAVTLAALFALQGGSCVRVERPYPAPTADQVLQALTRRAAAVRSLRAEARMAYRTNQGKLKATVRMMARQPDRLRFDVVSPFDTALATLVCSEGRFALVDAQKNRHFHGPASPCNLARLLRVELTPRDVLTVLGGATPLIPHTKRSLSWDDRAGQEVLRLEGAGRTQTIRLDGRDRRWRLVSSEVRDARGTLQLSLRAGNFHEVKGVAVARQLSVKQPPQKASLELLFKRQELNLALPAAAFERPGPEGLRSQRVECTTRLRLK